MGHDEVLAPGLAHDPGEGPVAVQIVPNLPPEGAQDVHGPCEVESCERVLGQADVGGQRPVAVDQVDHTVGKPRFAEHFHGVVGGQRLLFRGLPHHHVAHEGRSRGQVAGDCREVEGRDGQDEPLQGPIVQLVPCAPGREGLLLQDPLPEVDVVPEEVHELAGRVDLGLPDRLGLTENRSRVQGVPVGTADQFGRLQEDGGPLFEGGGGPVRCCGLGGLHGSLHVGGPSCLNPGDLLGVMVGGSLEEGVVPPHLLSADHHGRFGRFAFHGPEPVLQALPFGGSWSILEDGFIHRDGNWDAAVAHGIEPP